MSQVCIEARNVRWACPLLRSKYGRRAIASGQRIAYIAGHTNPCGPQSWIQIGKIDGDKIGQTGVTWVNLLTVGIEKLGAQAACQAPAPPSTVALPPTPRMISTAPRSRAARISCPVPNVVVRKGSRSSRRSKGSPEARAISATTTPSPSRPISARIDRSRGSQHVDAFYLPIAQRRPARQPSLLFAVRRGATESRGRAAPRAPRLPPSPRQPSRRRDCP